MASNHADVRLFEIIGNDSHHAVYDRRATLPLDGRHPKEVVRDTVNKGQWPSDEKAVSDPQNPDRYLDIVERRSGICTYLFWLNARRGGKLRLRFVPAQPFLPLPLNSSTGEQFLGDFETHDGGNGRWASFSFDMDAVRNSELVRRLRAYYENQQHDQVDHDHERLEDRHELHGNGHEHLTALIIPFTFNLVDPETDVAPWIFPREAEKSMSPTFTHGGIHPPSAAFLVLAVEE